MGIGRSIAAVAAIKNIPSHTVAQAAFQDVVPGVAHQSVIIAIPSQNIIILGPGKAFDAG